MVLDKMQVGDKIYGHAFKGFNGVNHAIALGVW